MNDDFFNIDDDFNNASTKNDIDDKNDTDIEFDFDDETNETNDSEVIDDETIDDEIDELYSGPTAKDIKKQYKKAKKISDDYKRGKIDIEDSVSELKGNIESIVDNMPDPEDMYIDNDLLPGIGSDVEVYDYIQEIEIIKIDSKDTLESLANLYLDTEKMKNKNIYKIIKNDADALADLNFSISMAKRALIGVMKQIDFGVNDPEMFQTVALFQKELRDTIKLTYDLQKKMKDFYKELKSELPEINGGVEEIEEEIPEEDQYTIIGDPQLLNKVFEQYKKDPTLLFHDNKENKDKSKDK
jgi:hypothetical protein